MKNLKEERLKAVIMWMSLSDTDFYEEIDTCKNFLREVLDGIYDKEAFDVYYRVKGVRLYE